LAWRIDLASIEPGGLFWDRIRRGRLQTGLTPFQSPLGRTT
jgi:hypothetical protein